MLLSGYNDLLLLHWQAPTFAIIRAVMQPDLSYLFSPTPIWLNLFFAATALSTLAMLYLAARRVSGNGATWVLIGGVIWLTLLALLAGNQFFQQLNTTPPHFVVAIGPPLLFIVGLFCTAKGRLWLSQLPLSFLTRLHTVRFPVELTLYSLYIYHQVPQLMTFEGGNYDILSGLTAPILAYVVFGKPHVSSRWLLGWNLVALGLVINIVVHAVLSVPLPFQQFAFEQPNVGILKLPYIWLPGFIVPTVLFSHSVAIFQLMKSTRPTNSSYKSE